MAVEIERKFLLSNDEWRNSAKPGVRISQSYLPIPNGVLRVRIYGNRAYLAIKGNRRNISKDEFEYEIPLKDAKNIMQISFPGQPFIEKTRYDVNYNGRDWVIDEFHGDNKGLLVAEIELSDENEEFDLPPWAGKEVSTNPRYYNSNLLHSPYKDWKS